MKRSFFLSLALHSLLLFSLVFVGGDRERPKAPIQIETVTPEEAQKGVSRIIDKEEGPGEVDCGGKAWFGGVGLTQNIMTGEILTIHNGYPAQRSGLLEGDVIISTENIKGELGTVATITVRRGERELTFNIKREKICITY